MIKDIKNFFHFLTTVLMYSIILILILVFSTVVIYTFEEKSNIESGKRTVPIFSAYVIITNSMDPKIKVNDAIINRRVVPSNIEVGDIITFVSESPIAYGKTITHRVIARSQDNNGVYYYKTKGDNNNVADSWLVPQQNVLGKTIFKIPKLGYLQWFLATSIGWVLLIIVPSFGIIIYDVIKLLKLAFKKPKESGD